MKVTAKMNEFESTTKFDEKREKVDKIIENNFLSAEEAAYALLNDPKS